MEQNDMNKTISEETDTLYSKVYGRYSMFREKVSEPDGKIASSDMCELFLASHSLSFLLTFFEKNFASVGIFQDACCILEGLALKEEIKKRKDVDPFLLEMQPVMFAHRFFDGLESEKADRLKRLYPGTCAYLKKCVNGKFDEEQAEKIMESEIPCLMEPGITYQRLISDNLDPRLVSDYRLCKAVLSIGFFSDPAEEKYRRALDDVWKVIDAYYGKEKAGYMTLKMTYKRSSLDKISKYLTPVFSDIHYELTQVIKDNEKRYQKNLMSDLLRKADALLQDIYMDMYIGFDSFAKGKFVPLFEIAVFLLKRYAPDAHVGRQELIDEWYRLKKDEIDDTSRAYDIYRKIYGNSISRENFDSLFLSGMGFTMDGKGKVMDAADFVLDFMGPFFSDGKEEKEKSKAWVNAVKCDFIDDLLLTRPSGYLTMMFKRNWKEPEVLSVISTFHMIGVCFLLQNRYYEKKYKESKDCCDKISYNVFNKAAVAMFYSSEQIWSLMLSSK